MEIDLKNKNANMTIERINIDQIKLNKDNIKDDKFNKLVKSIKDFPEMLDVRPIVVDDDMIVLGGNMRLKACEKAGLTEVPIIRFSNLTDEKKKEFIIKDNNSYGDWDVKLLSEWDKNLLLDGGFEQYDLIDIFGMNEMTAGMTKALEGSNYNEDVIDVNDYIKQNILFFNELMIEFEDDDVKKAIRNLKSISTFESFVDEIKSIIKKYGSNEV